MKLTTCCNFMPRTRVHGANSPHLQCSYMLGYWSVWILYLAAVIRLRARGRCFTVKLHQSCWWTAVQNGLLVVWSEQRMWYRVTWHHCDFTWMFGHCVFMERGVWWCIWLWYVKILELWMWCMCMYIYIYISVPKYFSVNAAEGVNCNVVFILWSTVLSVTFMRCQTVCIKMLFVWCVLLYSLVPSTNIFICTAICLTVMH